MREKLDASKKFEDADVFKGATVIEKEEFFKHYDVVRELQGRLYGLVIVSASDDSEQLISAVTQASFAADMAPPLSCVELSGSGGKTSFYFDLGDASQQYDSLLYDDAPRIFEVEFIPMAENLRQTINALHENNLYLDDEFSRPLTILRSKDRYLLKEFPLAVRRFKPGLPEHTAKMLKRNDWRSALNALEKIACKNKLMFYESVQEVFSELGEKLK